ncbi:hypothetical protein SEA_NAPOLEONB_63 [Arthrobacter phage NapoleonB]|uniref:Membrane protein n=1 Tax=Arthrobacter phage Dynamite TaxID=2867479 RepID=A0AAE9BRH9_9CAUD|nr:membrane protein [Arthrobacter phage Dynamite]QFP95031.1 hypothetical protein SEA_NAPOLEONB_63 [Arthrobacter phage NapoleonB]UAW09224.1 membrane protein [Arthrobacter phage Dynamite]
MDLNVLLTNLTVIGFMIWLCYLIAVGCGVRFKKYDRPARQELYSRQGKAALQDEPKPNRRYWIRYDLIYDWGASSQFSGYYRTYLGARIAAFYHARIGSWGGDVVLIDRYKEIDERSKSRN